MLLWFLVLQIKAVLGNATCCNHLTRFVPSLFREGDWFEQVRVYPGPGEYVSDLHPKETVSMFAAKYNTNCGYFELEISRVDTIELFKGYYVPRFQERYYPFKVTIQWSHSGSLASKMYLEKSQCEHFTSLNSTIRQVDILETDYSSYIIIHQCVRGHDYLMLLTKKKQYEFSEKHNVETSLIGIMTAYGITIENQKFSWVETTFCDKLL